MEGTRIRNASIYMFDQRRSIHTDMTVDKIIPGLCDGLYIECLDPDVTAQQHDIAAMEEEAAAEHDERMRAIDFMARALVRYIDTLAPEVDSVKVSSDGLLMKVESSKPHAKKTGYAERELYPHKEE